MTAIGNPFMTNVTSASDFEARVEAKRYSYFTLPVLEVSVKYRKPDVLKLALTHSLPTAISDQVIKVYKAGMDGNVDSVRSEVENTKIFADDNFLTEIRDKGYILLKELCVSHKILDVPQSDFSNDVVSWNDIPEEDAIAFLMHLINQANTSTTVEGGEVSKEDIETFPNSKPVKQRRNAREHV